MNCVYHPERESVSNCSKCGKPLCEDCSKFLSNTCLECSEAGQKAVATEAGEFHLMNWWAWIGSFISPGMTFMDNRNEASFTGTVMNILVGLINAGIVALILVMLIGKAPQAQRADELMSTFGYTTLFIVFLLVWFINSLVSYSLAMLAGGLGSFKQHLYILSLPIPLSPAVALLIAALLNFLFSLHISIGIFVAIILAFYIVSIQLAAIKEAHKFKTPQATLSGVVPIVITCAVLGLLIILFKNKT